MDMTYITTHYWTFVAIFLVAALVPIGVQAVFSGPDDAKWAAVVWLPGMFLWGSVCWMVAS